MPAHAAVHRSETGSVSPRSEDLAAAIESLHYALQEPTDVRLRSAFREVENMLSSGNRELRSTGVEFLDGLQDSIAWVPQKADFYAEFMGPRTRSLWSALHAIRSDLSECSVLEAEVALWRLVHRP